MGGMQVFTFLGGIGLFLLGMRLMSDGLRAAAGGALRDILAASTRSRLRGLFSGVLITAAVQSSSAVIFATVGFVNAGLLTLTQAIGVIYGASLGTTLTSWIVALIGFNVDLQALALPAVGIGMGLRVVAGSRRRQALGDAIAGLGLFFLGLDILRGTFADLGDPGMLAVLAGYGVLSLLLFVAIGMVLTTLTQSSSAALAITLTAAAGGLVPEQAAAATVIGAAVGTTSTAVFATLGATANAQRTASAQVIFNTVAGMAALAALVPLLELAHHIVGWLGLAAHKAVVLAVFHTLMMLLGLALMWPATPRLVAWLERRFRRGDDGHSRPRYLDDNVLATPALALDAARLEAERTGAIARGMVTAAISGGGPAQREWLEGEYRVLEQLTLTINEFANRIERSQSDPAFANSLAHLLRVTQYQQDMAERAVALAKLDAGGETRIDDPELAAAVDRLLAEAVRGIEATGEDLSAWDRQAVKAVRKGFDRQYQPIKERLLRAGAEGRLPVRRMVAVLDRLSAVRRALDQATKSARYLRKFQNAERELVDSGGADEVGLP
ncbi:Na/Pi cotransporter family protein [Halorhodospira halophila]|uniref:Na+/Pi-cotransporter n=1 Tax=Halorhodospira halophila (strain DSM 244 / SL1) TaxID=349124 RepID=A1WU87_HALHL|nr:Na/Pi symporter [Halorhodospira halophila]ABM61249.1 Na+/Pi-cotransporter [Halorhodospira halophila SL1]MBK1730019.1 Na/Pi cotransporter family protein [Halorhodospira halophila]